jgi:hypothetical protein
MDLIDHVELSSQNAKILFPVFVDWFEDCQTGFDEGIYDEEPSEDDRIAYEFATHVRGEITATGIRIPIHAAMAIECGVSSHLENIESGLAEGIFTDPAPDGAATSLADLKTEIEALDRSHAFS